VSGARFVGLDFSHRLWAPAHPLPGLFLEGHDQNRRYSDFLLPQWILCRCRSRGRNSAWLTTGVAYAGQVRCSGCFPTACWEAPTCAISGATCTHQSLAHVSG
jgi:hypothetical protein